jgi:hypothetical protein
MSDGTEYGTDASAESALEFVVHEAVGPPIKPDQAAAIIAMGSLALIMAGVMPVLLGTLADAGRLSAAGIGQCAMLEGLSMGLTAGIAGMVLKPEGLRLIGILAALALAILNIATVPVSGISVIAVRGLAGVAEGLLLWITIGMIVRSEVPERWAGVFFTSFVSAQLFMALLFAVYVMPRFGSDGGFLALALSAFAGIALATRLPQRYETQQIQPGKDISGAPPLRGWAALGATLIFTAAAGAVAVYLQPLAHQAGLGADVARTTLWISLAAQVAGGVIATSIAGRVHYFTVFCLSTVGLLICWATMAFHPAAWLFMFVNAMAGLVIVLYGPFLVPMTIEADPSRRAAMQSASAQVLAGALGPLLASFVVDERNAYGVLYLGAGLIVSGLTMMAVLHLVALREHRIAQAGTR